MKLLLLLVVQILAVAFIIITGPVITDNIVILAIEVLALFLIIWTLWTIMIDKFSLHNPNLKKSRLVPKGPFIYVRYPVYSALLILTVCWMINYINVWRFLVFVILLISIVRTVSHYEHILSKNLSDFGLYKQKTYKLFPFVY